MSARRTLVTPEGIDLGLHLADAGQRITAFLIDLLIIIAALIALTIVALVGLFSASEGAELVAMVWLLGFFLLRNLYFLLQEIGPRAATFGKRAVGLRVVARGGGRLTADSVIARNLMREIELYLPLSFIGYRATAGTADGWMALAGFSWACLFLFVPLLNRDRLRAGDLIAGTWVIRAPKRQLGEHLAATAGQIGGQRLSEAQLDVYGVYELQTLEDVLRQGNPDSIATVAHAIRLKLSLAAEDDDHAFLRAFYEASRAHAERKLILGQRRENKFHP